MMVPAGHSYAIDILDTQWACDPWTGDLLTDRNSREVQVELALYPATPLVVRVTRGSDDPCRTRRYCVAAVLEREHCDLKPFAFLAEHIRRRDSNVLQ